MATAAQFLEWLRESGCGIYRPGIYDISVDELDCAFSCHMDGYDSALDELDAIVMWRGMDPESLLTDEQLRLAEKMVSEGSVWGRVPPHIARLARRTRADIALRESYQFRRVRASSHIADPEVRKRIFERDEYCCKECGSLENLSIDHIVSVLNGGDDSDENLQTLCRSCNSRKGAKL